MRVNFVSLVRDTWLESDDVVPQHHHHILMHYVVAVNGILAEEVAETNEDLDFLVRPQKEHVFLALLVRERRRPLPQENSEFLEMNMNGVRPLLPSLILDCPDESIWMRFCEGALLKHIAHRVAVEEFPINLPYRIIVALNELKQCVVRT